VKKYLFLTVAAFSLMGCLRYANEQTTKVIIQNGYGEVVSWKSFPVVFVFHKDFPKDKRLTVQAEVDKFNEIMGQEIFKISSQESHELQPERNVTNGVSTLYWNFNASFRMTPAEQGRTTIFWSGQDIYEADINLQEANLTEIDFATLIRHELFHSLGAKHVEHTLMHPYLPNHTTREWDLELIAEWKKDLIKYTEVKFASQKESKTLASQK
jgi:hypothetical protein